MALKQTHEICSIEGTPMLLLLQRPHNPGSNNASRAKLWNEDDEATGPCNLPARLRQTSLTESQRGLAIKTDAEAQRGATLSTIICRHKARERDQPCVDFFAMQRFCSPCPIIWATSSQWRSAMMFASLASSWTTVSGRHGFSSNFAARLLTASVHAA